MWLLTNTTPFRAERTWVRDLDGAEIWLVAVRAVFDIDGEGSVALAAEQQDVVRVAEFAGEPNVSGLVYDSDLVRTKLGTDVVLRGHAYAPQGDSVRSLEVRLSVGVLRKSLTVHGDRVWERGLGVGVKPSGATRFIKQPIVYERAFGGSEEPRGGSSDPPAWDPRNPIGLGVAKDPSDLVDTPVPNIEYPDQPVRWKHKGPPASFAPIPQTWSPRKEFAGTYDEAWMQHRQPLLPKDFDERHYQCAPSDQQVGGFLRGGESIELLNLSPRSPVLRFRLPRIVLGFTTYFSDGEVRHHRSNLHSVILEPDYPRAVLVWHTALPCHPKVLKLHETVVSIKQWWRGGTEDTAAEFAQG